eukprot:6995983-Karenia_brevis.AAC.1
MHSAMRDFQRNVRAAQQALTKPSVSYARMIQQMRNLGSLAHYDSSPYQAQIVDFSDGATRPTVQHHQVTSVDLH